MSGKIRYAFAFLLGALFVYAGITKVLDPVRFFTDIQNYGIIPWRAVTVAFAFYLPWLEIISGMAVVVRPLRAGALAIMVVMLLIFTVALGQAWARGLDISCGCFGGTSDHPHYLLWLGRDLGLLIAALMLAISEWISEQIHLHATSTT
jgi:uncharacterized membrane protein YphA (DoxX/SURF4 family)